MNAAIGKALEHDISSLYFVENEIHYMPNTALSSVLDQTEAPTLDGAIGKMAGLRLKPAL
ncbi:MAG: hypothetical protein J6Q14_04920 [Oscillospiraceae bacterium]|nr:hypothetical protein [Oscillospiraceae bacterium]